MDNKQSAFSYLVAKGYSPSAAAGIVGNLVQESGVNPVVNPGDSGTAHGIAQWRGDRYTGLIDFAKNNNASANELNTQLDYLDNELRGKYGSTFEKVMSAKTPEDAAAAFALGYERPKGAETGIASNVDGWSNRLAAANAAAGYTPTTPSNTASGVTPVVPGGLLGLRAAVADKPTESDVAQLNKLFQSIGGASSGSSTPKKISVPEESLGAAAPMVRHLEFSGYRPKPKQLSGLLG